MLHGGAESDNLVGDSGNDMLMGEAGGDRLVGGMGADASPSALTAAMRPHQVNVADAGTGALVSWNTNVDGTAEGSVPLHGVYTADLRQNDLMFNEEPAFVAGNLISRA